MAVAVKKKLKLKLKLSAPLPTEYQEQESVIAWARAMTPRVPVLGLLFAIPNGAILLRGPGRFAILAQLKKQGCSNGVPDLCLPVPQYHELADSGMMPPTYLGYWIEMKRRKGGVLSDDQLWWHKQLRAWGHRVDVCEGADAAIAGLKTYLGIMEK